MKRTWLILSLVLASLVVWAIDPAQTLKDIYAYRTKMATEARDAKKTMDIRAVNAEMERMAKQAVKGQDPMKVDAAQALEWAQLWQLANEPKNACMAAERFIMSNPTPEKKLQAQNIMLSSCNELGEADMLMKLLKDMDPTEFNARLSLASSTAYIYADTIKEKMGLDAALSVLKLAEVRAKSTTTTDEKLAPRIKSTVAGIIEARAEMLNDAGRKADAISAIEEGIAYLGDKDPSARSLNGLKNRINLLGSAAPALNMERQYGSFAGLDSLKGKVVILDFFAHWCGPCIASFPDMIKMYEDLKADGLEVVGITTYYGYYKTENREKRDMAKDVEFGKMGDFIKDHKLPWPVIYGDRENFNAYGVTGIPHVAVIDRKGNVHKIKVGYSAQTFKVFRAEIEKLINEK